jgi:antitoxin ParD1/3/4
MPTRNVNLTEHYDQFVEDQIAEGHYKNASEVMRAGLHLLEQRTREDEARLTALRRLAAEGFDELNRGDAIALEDDQQLEAFISRAGERASRRAEGRPRGG